jgi:transposase
VRFACPEQGCEHRQLPVRDHSDEREWRHLDSMQFLTYLHARPPWVECLTHGVRQVRLAWAEPMSRFTLLFERLAIDVLKECHVEAAA